MVCGVKKYLSACINLKMIWARQYYKRWKTNKPSLYILWQNNKFLNLVGDFTKLEGATVDEIISRVPKDWKMLVQKMEMV